MRPTLMSRLQRSDAAAGAATTNPLTHPTAAVSLAVAHHTTPHYNTPHHRDRVQNLFFAYLFVLRAVMKAAPVLTTYQYDTGLPQEDATTQNLITDLVSW